MGKRKHEEEEDVELPAERPKKLKKAKRCDVECSDQAEERVSLKKKKKKKKRERDEKLKKGRMSSDVDEEQSEDDDVQQLEHAIGCQKSKLEKKQLSKVQTTKDVAIETLQSAASPLMEGMTETDCEPARKRWKKEKKTWLPSCDSNDEVAESSQEVLDNDARKKKRKNKKKKREQIEDRSDEEDVSCRRKCDELKRKLKKKKSGVEKSFGAELVGTLETDELTGAGSPDDFCGASHKSSGQQRKQVDDSGSDEDRLRGGKKRRKKYRKEELSSEKVQLCGNEVEVERSADNADKTVDSITVEKKKKKKKGKLEVVSSDEETSGAASSKKAVLSAEVSAKNSAMWSAAEFEDNARKNKFLRLLGGKKAVRPSLAERMQTARQSSSSLTLKSPIPLTPLADTTVHGSVRKEQLNKALSLKATSEMNAVLEQQFQRAIDLRLGSNRSSGLGYSGKKISIDANAVRSTKL